MTRARTTRTRTYCTARAARSRPRLRSSNRNKHHTLAHITPSKLFVRRTSSLCPLPSIPSEIPSSSTARLPRPRKVSLPPQFIRTFKRKCKYRRPPLLSVPSARRCACRCRRSRRPSPARIKRVSSSHARCCSLHRRLTATLPPPLPRAFPAPLPRCSPPPRPAVSPARCTRRRTVPAMLTGSPMCNRWERHRPRSCVARRKLRHDHPCRDPLSAVRPRRSHTAALRAGILRLT